MLLILSESGDRTTDEVLQWLLAWGVCFLRINTDDAVEIVDVSPSSDHLIIKAKGGTYNLADFDRVWFRRGVLSLRCFVEAVEYATAHHDARNVVRFIQAEWDRLREYIFFCLERKDALGSFSRYNLNKLSVLHLAKECGLDIPETLVSEDARQLAAMAARGQLITKPISEAYAFGRPGGPLLKMLTTTATAADWRLPIFPSLVQERLDKWVELRVVYLCGRCYTGAIFSQNDAKTAVDYRNYGGTENRIVPFALPIEVSQKIDLLMGKLNLDMGSIDMVLTRDMRYVFLEVNPVGNIEMVSKPCNYPIEREIAKILSNANKNTA